MTRKTAQEIREAADRIAIESVIAAFPAADEIPPREVFSPEVAMDKLAADPKRRAEQLAERLESWSMQLREDVQRYEDVRTRGVHAVSDYDLTIAYGEDATAAVRDTLKLKVAHISYARSALLVLLAEQADAAAAIEADRLQLPLF